MKKIWLKKQWFLIMMLCLVCCTAQKVYTVTPAAVYAESGKRWTDGADKSIYDGEDKKEKNIDLGEADDKKMTGKSSSALGSIFAGLLNVFSDWFGTFFELTGMTLKNVVYGRVGGGGVTLHLNGKAYRASLFTFETAAGNPYGIVSFAVYSALRVLALILTVIFVGTRFVGALWSGNTESAKKAGGEAIKNAAVFFILLMGMPMILDLVLYLRDVFLYAVNSVGTSLLGISSGADMGSAFDVLSEDNPKNIMVSLLRLASKFLTLYFAFAYVGVALSFVVDVMAFPFVGLSMIVNPRILGQWAKSVVSLLLVPVVDCILLLVVLFLSVFGENMAISFLQLMVLYMLIPARAQFREVLGLSSGFRMEMAGVGGFAAAVGLAGAAVQGAASVLHGGKQAYDMNRMGDMYDDISQAQANSEGNTDADGGVSAGGVVNDPDGPSGDGGGGGVVNDYGSVSSSAASETMSAAANNAAQDGFLDADGAVDVESVSSADMADGTAPDPSMASGGSSAKSFGAADSVRTAGGNYVPNSVLRRYANTGNFQDGMFNALTAQQKADLYHKKAEQMAVGTLAGAMGGVAGAGLGLAATISSGGMMGGFGPGTAMRAGRAAASMASGAVDSMDIGLRKGQDSMMDPAASVMLDPMMDPTVGQPASLEMDQGLLLEQTSATFGEEELAAAREFMTVNPSFDQQLAAMESFPDVEGFDEMFDQCGEEYVGIIGTDKPQELQTEESRVWADTPEDRYQYFRTQKAEPALKNAFGSALDAMTPLEDKKQNEQAKELLADTYGRMVSQDAYGGLSKEMLSLQGYGFENGFTRVSPDSETVRSLARDHFMVQNPGITSVVRDLSDAGSNGMFDEVFYDCSGEWENVVGTEKPQELQTNGDILWQNTPEDRYQYFRTQKAEPALKNAFGSALDTMTPLPNARSNAVAKRAVLDEYAQSISGSNYPALKKENLELFGYNFENGFLKDGQVDHPVSDGGSVIV